MMNLQAFALLLSSLGAVMFLSPEPTIRRINNEVVIAEAASSPFMNEERKVPGPVESAKRATEDVVQTASDYAKHTGEGIRRVGSAAYEKVSGAANAAKDSVKNAGQSTEDSIRRQLEEDRRAAHQTNDAAKARIKEGFHESSRATSDYATRAKDTAQETKDGAKSRFKEGVHESSHAASDYATRAKDSAQETKDAAKSRIKEGVHESSHAASDYATRTKDTVSGAAGRAKDAVSNTAGRARDAVTDTAAKTRDSLGDAAYSVGDTIKSVGRSEDDSATSKIGRAKEILKERVQEAAQYQPNLGQGLGYYPAADSFGVAEDEPHKMEDYLEGAKRSAKDAMDRAADGLGFLKHRAEEEEHDGYISVEAARRRIRESYDTTKMAVLEALSRREQELGSSLEASKTNVESYYDKAKEASVASVENRKETLREYLDMVKQKLNAGREAVFQYAISSKDAVVDESKREIENLENTRLYRKVQELEEEAAKWGSNAKDKVNETLKQAGRWAHEKMVKLNETEQMALAICKHWVHKSVASVVRLLHLFVFSSVYGSSLWVTFISGFVLSKSVSQHQFGVVQSKLFPVYFRMVASGIALLLATHTILHPFPSADLSELLQYYNLGASLIFTLLNTFVLEPRQTKFMFEKLRLEKEEGRGVDAGQVPVLDEQAKSQMIATSKKLSALHGYSSAANLAMLAGLTWHLWYLNRRLVI